MSKPTLPFYCKVCKRWSHTPASTTLWRSGVWECPKCGTVWEIKPTKSEEGEHERTD